MKRQGLYDPAYEHDACGVAFVARLDGGATHEAVARALDALERLEHRGAAGADASTGDGAGILLQLPHAFFRAVVGVRARAGRVRRRRLLPAAATARAGARARAAARRTTVEDEGQHVARLARRAGRPATSGATARLVRARASGSSSSAAAERWRRPGRVRAQALRDPARRRDRRRPRARDPELLVADARLQGDADRAAAARATSPTSPTSGSTSALALVHSRFSTNTFPSWELAHPYRHARAQRRDQHAARQRQLDGRARVAARLASSSATTSRRCCRSSGRAAPTPRRSTTCSSCSCSPAARCRTR